MTEHLDENTILIIAGPTASGKSGLAIEAAIEFGGVVINADSMQIYQELSILTARPGAEDMARAPHRLYGILPASTACSVGQWRDLAITEIESAWSHGKLPILTGGTGLYFKSLMDGLSDIPDIPDNVRKEARARHAEIGATAFHEELAALDPDSAARLFPSDTQRTIRAYEVFKATGRSLNDWHEDDPATPPLAARYFVIAFEPPREELYATCEARFDQMMENGAVAEAEALLALGLDPSLPAMKALGIAELCHFLKGEMPEEEAIARAKQATRNYAKRQLTWFRNQINASETVFAQYSESLLPKIFPKIRKFVLTPQK